MQNHVNSSDKDEEIDLAKVAGKVRAALSRRKKLFFLFLIVGISSGILYYNFTSKVYKSRMVISSTVFQGPSFMIILDNLILLLEEQNYEELATVLQIDVSTAEKIKDIEVYSSRNYAKDEFGDKFSFQEEKLLEMSDKKEEFVIEAYVKENEVFKALEKGIVDYLNNNPAIKQNSAIKREALKEMKSNIHRQRMELDSLKNSLASILTRESVSKDIYIASPGAMYTDMINLYSAEVRATEALLASQINVIESFRIYKKQHSPRLGKSLIAFTFISMSIFIALVIYLEGSRKKEAL